MTNETSPASTSKRKIEHNLDIKVPSEIIKKFPDLVPILANANIEKEFLGPEKAANRYKFWFNFTGILSLIFIVAVLIIISWRLGWIRIGGDFPEWIIIISAILGALSFVLAITAFILKLQDKWLYNRFVTERLRQWKFQQLLDGEFINLSKTNKSAFEEELQKRWDDLRFKFSFQRGAMDKFVMSENFELYVEPTPCTDVSLSKQIFDAYLDLRLDYQETYFSWKQNEFTTFDEWTKGLAKFFLLSAGALALAEVIILLLPHDSYYAKYEWMIGTWALIAAILTAAIRVFRHAKAFSEETERYINKRFLFKLLSERFKATNKPEKKLEQMIETERVSLEELREFIRTFRKSDYLL